MVSVLDSGSSGPGSSPGRGHCVDWIPIQDRVEILVASCHRNQEKIQPDGPLVCMQTFSYSF